MRGAVYRDTMVARTILVGDHTKTMVHASATPATFFLNFRAILHVIIFASARIVNGSAEKRTAISAMVTAILHGKAMGVCIRGIVARSIQPSIDVPDVSPLDTATILSDYGLVPTDDRTTRVHVWKLTQTPHPLSASMGIGAISDRRSISSDSPF